MNKAILVSICIAGLVIGLPACTSNTQQVVSYYDSGAKIKKEEYTVNKKTGHKDGPYKAYFESGALKMEAMYKDDSLQDTVKKYSDAGRIVEKCVFKNNRQNGPRILYNANGTLSAIENYKDDMFDGPYFSFHEDGSKDEVGQFTKNKKKGKWVSYYKDGKEESEYNFDGENNEENGPYTLYFRTGKIAEKGTMLNGNEDGDVTYYDSTGGSIERIRVYADGRPIKDIKPKK